MPVEQLYEHLAHVVAYPLVVDSTAETAPLFCRYREIGHLTTFLQPWRQRQTVGTLYEALHHRGELDVPAAYLLEEPVERQRVVGIEIVDDGQRIPLYTMLLKQVDAMHHLAPRRLAST